MRILMMGTGSFAEPAFESLCDEKWKVVGLVTNPDRAKGRPGRNLETERTIKLLALDRDIPVFQPENVNAPESVEHIKTEFRPDLFLVAAYGQILSPELLSIPRHGGINIHSSLLPKYRGAAPIVWAIYYGDRITGVTVIRMSPRMDAGEMLGSIVEEIQPNDTAASLEARLAKGGAKLAMRVIDQIEQGAAKGIPQDSSLITKAPKLTKEMGLIDFKRSAHLVDCQIRAMQPWPVAYTFWHDQQGTSHRLIVHKAIPSDVVRTDVSPGVVCLVNKEQVGVACGDGTVVLLDQVQPPGKRPMKMADYLRGHSIQQGDRFQGESSAS